MAKLIQELDKRIKGPMGEKEDWWYLMRDEETGELFVEHQWSHTKLNSLKTDSGKNRIAVDAFLKGNEPQASKAREALRKLQHDKV